MTTFVTGLASPKTFVAVLAAVWLASAALDAQQAPASRTAAWTRTPDGQPDIQGDWNADVSGTYDLTDPRPGPSIAQAIEDREGRRKRQPSRIVDPPDGKIPYQPWAASRQRYIAENEDNPRAPEHVDSQSRCLVGGAIREMFHTGIKLVQFPGHVVLLSGQNHIYRVIPLDGRPHVDTRAKLWMGDSRGRWEGTTLIVDVTGSWARGRLDMVGNFHSDAAHIVERFEFSSPEKFTYRATIDDPKTFTRPWTLAAGFSRSRPGDGQEFWENACHEGERSADAMVIDDTPAP